MSIKLNLGCGADVKNGYVNIDLYHDDPRVTKHDIERLDELYAENSVDEIIASDVIEHISHRKVKGVLKTWISILKPNGTLYIKTPDIEKQIDCFKSGIWNAEMFSYMVFGGQDTDGNYHKCTFTIEYLKTLLQSYGMNITSTSVEHFRLTPDVKTSANANIIVVSQKLSTQVRIGTSPGSSGLGDILLLTPLCREFPNSIVELTPQAAERFGCLFDGIAEVVSTPTPTITTDVGGGHFAQRKLRGMGKDGANFLPEIKITEQEKEEARKLVGHYDNPIIFVPNTAPRNKHQREFPWPNELQKIIDRLADRRTILQFGLSSNFTEFNNTIPMKDIPIRETAAIYSVVGEYFGVDTGDMHLMIAVGGIVNVLVPRSTPEYQHEWWHYQDPRVRYLLFENYQTLLLK